LVIAHHNSTLSKADQIIRLKHGRVEQVQAAQISSFFAQAESNLASNPYEPPLARISSSMKEPECFAKEKNETRTTVKRLSNLLTPFSGRIVLSMLLGFATIASGVGLMATSAYLISAAALHPSIAELQVAIVGVRFFGLSRGVFRYLERLVSHDITFRSYSLTCLVLPGAEPPLLQLA
jgi:ABC-type transport system involved in cytochrome bd biosynthesis fused ATPase/permease subunit